MLIIRNILFTDIV